MVVHLLVVVVMLHGYVTAELKPGQFQDKDACKSYTETPEFQNDVETIAKLSGARGPVKWEAACQSDKDKSI